MKKMSLRLILVVFTLLIVASCGKDSNGGSDIPKITLLQPWMSDGPWQLISYTRSNSAGIISSYKGTVMDTLQFGYTSDSSANIVLTNSSFYIQGVNTVCPYKYHLQDTTMIFGPSCRANYNDTIKVTSFSEYLTVFKVKFDSADIHGWEIDSLKKIHFY